MNAYDPHVYINGARIDSQTPNGLAAIASLRVKWGASDWYSNVEPAELTLSIFDNTGQFLSITSGYATSIRVTYDDPQGREQTVFYGTVDSAHSTLVKRQHPGTGKVFDAWRVEISARDLLAQLAGDRSRGPGYPLREGNNITALHWGPQTMGERKAALDTRTPAPIVWPSDPLSGLDNVSASPFPVAAYSNQQTVSALTVLRNTARISEIMNRPYYNPQSNRIEFYAPPRMSDITLTDLPAIISGSSYTMDHIPASKLAGPTKVSTDNTMLASRGEVKLRREVSNPSSTASGSKWEMSETYPDTVQIGAADGIAQLTVELETDYSGGWSRPADQFDLMTDVFRGTYGKQASREMTWRIDAEKDATDGGAQYLNEMFLKPVPPRFTWNGTFMWSFFLRGNAAHWAPGTGLFCIVGGEIEYSKRGWAAHWNTLPAPTNTPPTAPTLGEITDEIALNQIDPEYTIADLMRVTKV